MSYEPSHRRIPAGYAQQPWPPDHYASPPAFADAFDGYPRERYGNQWPHLGAGQRPDAGWQEPGRNGPGWQEPGRNGPGWQEPGQNGPGWNGAGGTEQNWTEQNWTDQNWSQPGWNEQGQPSRNEPGWNEPGWNEPGQPGWSQQGWNEQGQQRFGDDPGFTDPAFGESGPGGGRHEAARTQAGRTRAGRAGAGWPARGARRFTGRGVIVGAVTGFLAAAMAIGIATLAAAFFRPQASPIIAVGESFIDRTPPALKNFAVEKFGENDKTMLLLGMYVTIALLAMAIGVLARKRVSAGVIGVAVFGLFGAFVAYTRPASKPSDVIPSVIGGVAGVLALLWLDHAAAAEVERSWLWSTGVNFSR
ncbi:MAG TPA: hypothetical protein VGG16_20755 [Streptosporangiaceae bacterium]